MTKKRWVRLCFVLPFMVPLVIFWVIPLICAFAISLTDWDYISPSANFVGLTNYIDLLTDSDFLEALVNTLIFGFGTIAATIILGLLMAMFFRKKFIGSGIYQLVIFSPWITPTVAVALVWTWIYDPDKGLLNYILQFFSMGPLQWLTSSSTAMLGVIIFTIWKSIGWTMIFYIGALEKVPKSAYEAARIDGSNWWTDFTEITLPLISPTTYFLVIINLINSIQVYDQIKILTQGGPAGSTTTLLYFYYKKAFQNFQMGPANGVAMMILILIVLLSWISTKASKHLVHYD